MFTGQNSMLARAARGPRNTSAMSEALAGLELSQPQTQTHARGSMAGYNNAKAARIQFNNTGYERYAKSHNRSTPSGAPTAFNPSLNIGTPSRDIRPFKGLVL